MTSVESYRFKKQFHEQLAASERFIVLTVEQISDLAIANIIFDP